ncbi:Glycosyltransferase, catalytic subunit of cellulose synthase and poly-beta-1,6-N-acetylglucosamine synthase [Phyllobacterium sp. YR620]|nr:Glycosyltransferase, catalytic subunit of cellulose synthase and poly-beta-1,6-N-acetylglucosamine synthase [Phyllobacterium sp. YR620]
MRQIEAALAARLCQAGTAKHAIIAAFREAVSNRTSLLEEVAASGIADEAAIGRAIAVELGLSFAAIPEGAIVIGKSSAVAPDLHSRRLMVVTAEGELLHFAAPTLTEIGDLKHSLSFDPAAKARTRITTPTQLHEFIRSYRERELLLKCVNRMEIGGLERTSRVVLSGTQGIILGIAISLGMIGLIFHLSTLWDGYHYFSLPFFFACIALRFRAAGRTGEILAETGCLAQRHGELPFYTVMIALYKEAAVVPQLVRSMQRLHWPKSRLEVLFLCEADDTSTLKALADQTLPPGFKIVPVANFGPRTKPKALNYGLQLAKGDFVVVYDAEDRPHPDQLVEAWRRFDISDVRLACLQAPLIISNAGSCLLARLFAFEYAAHFGGLLPWLARHGFILPLGGSSNHFRRNCLEAVRGWDPYNVTEDAELGARLARCGYDVGVISRPTLEDAPVRVDIWLRQRTRWLKGWAHTWLVEMRNPRAFLREVGLQRFMVFQTLVAGIIVSSIVYPFMLLWIGFGIVHIARDDAFTWHNAILALDLVCVVMGFLSFHRLGQRTPVAASISGSILQWLPLYWLLTAMAAWRAIWQLGRAPSLWEKTPHDPSGTLLPEKISPRPHRNSWPEPMISASSLPTTSMSRPLYGRLKRILRMTAMRARRLSLDLTIVHGA